MSTLSDDTYSRPRLRYWLPGISLDHSILTRQLLSAKQAGFGGVEIAFLGNGLGKPNLRDEQKWGREDGSTRELIRFMMNEGERIGLHIDITIGPAFPAMVPGLSPDAPGAAKELVHGRSTVITQSGEATLPIPEPTAKAAGITPANADVMPKLTLLTVQGVKVKLEAQVEGGERKKEVKGYTVASGDGESIVDLSTSVKGENVVFDVPDVKAGYGWIIVASYCRGTAQTKSIFEQDAGTYTTPIASVVDHFSEDGVKVLEDFYARAIIDDDLVSKFRKGRSSLFEDSLELSQAQFFTPNFLTEFHSRRGYDLLPYLPLLHEEPRPSFFSPHIKSFGVEASEGRTLAERVHYDFGLTVSDLYVKRRLGPMKTWANSIGLNFRNQPYLMGIDAPLAATKVDIVEGETLCFFGNPDSFRMLATGRDVAGIKILSDELAAVMHKTYEMTWKRIIEMANWDFALGVNQIMLHGLPYDYTEYSEWPGYMPFSASGFIPGFADAWGGRQPQWQLSKPYVDYIANTQKILQKGCAKTDVAIYHSPIKGVKGGLKDQSLNDAGYSYGFPSEGLLLREDAIVKDGRLWPDGPAYKALIFDNEIELSLATAQKVVQLAKDGLPIIFVGSKATTIPGLPASGTLGDAEKGLASSWEAISGLDNVVQISTWPKVPAKLKAIGVSSLIMYEVPGAVTILREDGRDRYYYICNSQVAGVQQTVHIPVRGRASTIDAWDDNAEVPIENNTDDSGLKLKISLPAKGAMIVRIIEEESTAPADKSRSASTTEIAISDWTVSVESWEPAESGSKGEAAVKTRREQVKSYDATKSQLSYWSDNSDLADVSGCATYEATFDLSDLTPNVYLDLGVIDDAYNVYVNGEIVKGFDGLRNRGSIARHARKGANDLRIVTASTLLNCLKRIDPKGYEKKEPKKHGLRGPVRLTRA